MLHSSDGNCFNMLGILHQLQQLHVVDRVLTSRVQEVRQVLVLLLA